MRVHARTWVLSLICGVLLGALFTSAASAAEFPLVEKLVATNCTVRTCGQEDVLGPFFEPKPVITVKEAEEEGETEAGGRVPFGITDFKVLTQKEIENEKGEKVTASYATGTVIPTMIVKHIRTDVAPGLATNPFAVPMCAPTGKEAFGVEAVPGTGFFTAPGPECEESLIGEQQATVFGGIPNQPGFEKQAGAGDLPLSGSVYDLTPGGEETLENGAKLAALYGVALKLPKALTESILGGVFKGTKPELEKGQYYAHSLIKGSVEWGKEERGTKVGDFHDYFEIDVSEALPLVRSRLIFEGQAGNGGFITNATSCPGHLTTSLKVEDKEGVEAPVKEFTTPIGLEGCDELEFEPKFALTPASTLSDSPNEFSAEAVEEHEPEETDVSQVKSASLTLPEGMTLNPSAAAGLEACTTDQAHQISGGVFDEPFGVECPAGSKLGTVSLNVPTLPDGTLTGNVYLASGSKSATITDPPFDIYVVANSQKYGISVRLFGEAVPNPATGQLTTYFNSPPEQPFTSLAINFDRGALAPIANPLLCGTPQGSASFTPTSGGPVSTSAFGVNITGCASTPPPFALTQSTENEVEKGGSHTSYALSLARQDGQQYLKTIKTSLPLGLVGAIPAVEPLCDEAAANAGTCPASSRIGSVSVQAGAGTSPYTFNGSVYMTGPYNGAPYGLSIVVPATAGPFALGNVVTRAAINIDKTTAQVTAEGTVPTIFKGVPLRIRKINLNVNRQGFLYNPTNCTTQATLTTLTSTEGATQTGLSSPFTVTGCDKLPLAPKFAATTSSKVSRANGTSLSTTLTQLPGESNIKSVKVQLPKQLPSRDSTLKQACLAATFEANPESCPKGANVGTAEAVTPTLPLPMKGNAYFVSHGGAAFPDLDLVLKEGAVTIILVGNTDITKGITTTTFATTPDVPVSSVKVNLPAKSNSAVGGFGDLCHKPLTMPTTITGQNGKVTKLNTVISVTNCGVKIVGKKVQGNTAILTVQTFGAGRISGSGSWPSSGSKRSTNVVKQVAKNLSQAYKSVTLKVPLASKGKNKSKPLKVRIRVGFLPKKSGPHSQAYTTVVFH